MSAELNKACLRGDVATIQTCLARGVDINTKYDGITPLIAAVGQNNLEIVRILLARDELDIAATTVYYGWGFTALHVACFYGSAECVTLLGQDRRMTSSIINMKNIGGGDNGGNTAIMVAVGNNKLPCVERMAELDGVDWETENKRGESLEDVARRQNYQGIIKFIRKVKADKDSPAQFKKMKLSKLAQELEDLENKIDAEEIVSGEKRQKKEEELEAKYARLRESLEKELRQEMSAMHELHSKEKETLSNDLKKQKVAIESEIKARVSGGASLPPAPGCPICLDSLAPPARLYNCPEGHLLCSDCRTKVEVCQLCRKPVQGRATAMEQYLRAVYGQE